MTPALDAIRARDAAWGAETPGGKPWTSRQRGEAYFQAGYDRHVLLAALDRAEAVVVAAKDAERLAYEVPGAFPDPNDLDHVPDDLVAASLRRSRDAARALVDALRAYEDADKVADG